MTLGKNDRQGHVNKWSENYGHILRLESKKNKKTTTKIGKTNEVL